MRKIIYTCYQVNESYFMYERNRNKIIEISKEAYDILNKITSDEEIEQHKECLQPYLEQGFLQKDCLKEIKHNATDNVDLYIDHKVGQLLLQVTQNCNLRCKYCYFGDGNYNNRNHSNHVMTFEVAKKAIDYLFSHSLDQNKVSISFYGGEPLLNFKLIKQCVEYVDNEKEGKEVGYSMTTNMTLANDEIIDFWVKHNFMLLVSFDGDEKDHNKNRVFANGTGTHSVVLKNILKIVIKYPQFAKTIGFNTVLTPDSDFKAIIDYLYHIDELKDNIMKISLENDNYKDTSNGEYSEEYRIIKKFSYFQKLLEWLNKLEKGTNTKLYDTAMAELMFSRKVLNSYNIMAESCHPAGPCIAGSTKLFVTTDGVLYPCEKGSELSKNMQLGTIDEGIDLEKVKKLINVGKVTEESCSQCWAFYFCNQCALGADDCDELNPKRRLRHCGKVKLDTIHKFRTMSMLEDFGYSFEKGAFYD